MYSSLNGATAGGSLPIDQFVQLAKDAGFAGADVNVGWGVAHGAQALKDLYLSKEMRFGGWGAPDWRGDEVKWSEGLESLKASAKVASEIGADSCITWIMPSSKLALMENWAFHVRRLTPVARVLSEQGLRFGLEFVAPRHIRHMNPHEFVFTPGQMLELADAIGPNVGLLIDSFHLHASGETPERLKTIPAEKIVLAHLNDAPPVPVPDLLDGQRLLPGEGVLGAAEFVKALRATGYDGAVSVEVFSDELKKMPPADAARKAGEATRKVFQQAGI